MNVLISNFLSIHNLISSEIKSIDQMKYMFFVSDVSHIIDLYNNYISQQFQLFFKGDELKHATIELSSKLRNYVEFVNSYIPNRLSIISKYPTTISEPKCDCGGTIYNTGNGFNECSKCSHITDNDENLYVNDYFHSEHINISKKTIYNECLNFAHKIDVYNGDLKPIPNLDMVYMEYEIIKRCYIERLTLQDVKNVMKHIELPNKNRYYDYTFYIWHKITNKPLMNTRHIKELLVNDFKTLLNCYETNHKQLTTSRKSFLNLSYILYQLLYKHGYNHELKNILLLRSKERLMDHDDVYTKLCSLMKWNIPLKLSQVS